MIVISDTNILSSFAAAESFPLLTHLFPRQKIHIPSSVYQELNIGLDRGQTHLASILQAITRDEVVVIELSSQERIALETFPRKLNQGEREAIAMAKNRQALLLSNDKRAVRFCQQQAIEVLDLPELLRALWIRQVTNRSEVEQIIARMEQVENLVLSQADRARVFGSRRRRRRKP